MACNWSPLNLVFVPLCGCQYGLSGIPASNLTHIGFYLFKSTISLIPKHMLGFLSKIFGGSKSEKDVQKILPLVDQINGHFNSFGSLTHDQLRNKTTEFRLRIKDWLSGIDNEIQALNEKAEQADFKDITGKDEIYQQVDQLKKDRDKKIEEVLKEMLPEAFAVMKETARRFKENTELVVTATELDRELA
jgi:preprotein translocase subunit SecA